MALRGTLDDFGIANVFQLIGQQQKNGTLTVTHRDEVVRFHFDSGNIVRCEASRRQKQELLGAMLRRADAITEEQLTRALDEQMVTHKRVGDCLIDMGFISSADLKEFTRLQTSETVYRIFLWRAGSYEFAQSEQPPEAGHPPLRAEALLMEGFRQVDEWPAIRAKITSYAMTFTVLLNLDELLTSAAVSSTDELDFDLEGFGDAKPAGAAKNPRLEHIEHKERLVYSLIKPGRDVQKLIDLSRLGEFDTCRALLNLMRAGVVKSSSGILPAPSAEATVGGISAGKAELTLSTNSLTYGAWIAAALVAFVLVVRSGLDASTTAASGRAAQYLDMRLEDELSRGEIGRIREALAVYYASLGEYPDSLDKLVQLGLLEADALKFPWHQPYSYTRGERGYTLLRPLW